MHSLVCVLDDPLNESSQDPVPFKIVRREVQELCQVRFSGSSQVRSKGLPQHRLYCCSQKDSKGALCYPPDPSAEFFHAWLQTRTNPQGASTQVQP